MVQFLKTHLGSSVRRSSGRFDARAHPLLARAPGREREREKARASMWRKQNRTERERERKIEGEEKK